VSYASTGFEIEIGNLVLFLQSYFDESGKPADHDIASFCGFIAPSDKWREFVYSWGQALAYSEIRGPLKATEILKYRRALSPKIPAQTPAGRTEALAPFVTAIRASVGFGVAVAIDCRAFRGLPDADRQILKGEPHYWAFRMALLLIRQYAEHIYSQVDPDIQIALCCDEEERYSVECLKLFINIKREFPEMRARFPSIGFADDKHFPQLQAADLIASLARQEADRKFHSKPFDMKPLYDLMVTPNPKDRLNRGLLAVRDDLGADPAVLSVFAAFEHSHDGSLIFAASAGDLPGTDGLMHVPRFAADESFVRFDFTGELIGSRHSESNADSMIHEPSGFLSDTNGPMNLVGTDAVLAVHDLPHGKQPLV